MKLYDYWRSTASYRVRIALNIKKVHYDKISVSLLPAHAEHQTDTYLAINPQGLVPTLYENSHIVSQSLAIIEYLEDICPTPSLLPKTPLGKAFVRSIAQIIACDMHPLNNLRVLQQLKEQFNATDDDITKWYHLWLKKGFDAIEQKLRSCANKHPVCYGKDITLADVCLIPQVYNANRFNFDMNDYPLINAVNEHCLKIPAFMEALPTPPPQSTQHYYE